MTIRAILAGRSPDVHSVTADRSVGETVALLTDRRIGAVPVMQGDEVIGIFSERDVIHCLKSHGGAALDRPVREGMTSPAISVASDMSVLAALSLMTRRRIRHLPVVDDGRLVGFVSIGDLVKHRIERIEAEASALREYIAS
jgi:CBS domain-containing protein